MLLDLLGLCLGWLDMHLKGGHVHGATSKTSFLKRDLVQSSEEVQSNCCLRTSGCRSDTEELAW